MSVSKFFNNKPKMARFLNFKFLFKLKLNFNGDQCHTIFWLFQKVEKSHNKIVKFAVENFEHLG